MFHITITKKISTNESNLKNIISKKDGYYNKSILLCAHYDLRIRDKDDYTSRTPGAY
ncbi:MAG TPA: hypothetical protein VF222_07840 [Nitrososphaeraceae archaeon]